MTERVWIDRRDSLAVHDRLLVLYGGALGVRDEGLLGSAPASPQQHKAYGDNADVIELAAAYTAGIVKNHPFGDGAERTGFVVGILFLEAHRAMFAAREEAATQAVPDLAAGPIDRAGYAAFLRSNTSAGPSS